jgi:guanylate kinase
VQPVAKSAFILVLSAPSGAGKSAVLEEVMKNTPGLELSVSVTTRPPRPGEVEGVDYYFMPREEFEKRIGKNEFLEFAVVHDNLYGTLKSELDRHLRSGNDLVLELDVQGMRNIRQFVKQMVSVFLMPPSPDELKNRLRKRGTETEEALALRLRNAEREIAARGEFDYIVVNEQVVDAAADLRAILRAEHCRTHRQI